MRRFTGEEGGVGKVEGSEIESHSGSRSGGERGWFGDASRTSERE